MKRSIDDPQGYLERLKPLHARLYRMAHAIVGNREIAEYILRRSIVEAYLRRNEWREHMAFADGLTHTVRSIALAELKGIRKAGQYEEDWVFPLPPSLENAVERAMLSRIVRESGETPRIVLMRYGCEMNLREISEALRVGPAEVSGRLRRLSARLRRSFRFGKRPGDSLEDKLEAICGKCLSAPGEDLPELGQLFRSFERDVACAARPRPPIGRALGTAVKLLLAAALACAFWLAAVLLEPGATAPVPALDSAEIAENDANMPQN